MTLAYFALSGLDILGAVDQIDKKNFIEWIYSHQVHPDPKNNEKNSHNCGFRGSSYFGMPYSTGPSSHSHELDQSHIAMTYVALVMLLILGDDLSRVNKKAILEAMKLLQQENGSYSPVAGGSESDMRFVYCACSISYILNDWSGIDKEKAVKYIKSSQSYDYGIGQGPGQESHGGSTYCAIASLWLMNRLDDLEGKDQLIQWCVQRQSIGFQGRINKEPDTCYSWWIGATLQLLGAFHFVNPSLSKRFTLSCQADIGGFSKWPNHHPDVLHAYFSLCGLSFIGEPNLEKIYCALGCTERALKKLPKK
eukprot:TRINITY_DN8172_c0_g1_i1.p1 TRINITY_DN8172_c0_g1~~TRINITY_DN8172_c0_g1_i1.p1  ORF type:complete len:308 (-),score=38.50 TRINITY_DN8172_c0_g1_i1:37-960(-)